MSSPNTSKSRKKSDKVTIQHVQNFHKTLQTYLSVLHASSNTPYQQRNTTNQSPSQHDVYNYIEQQLIQDIRIHLLKFQPELQQYQTFTDIYCKCTEIIKDLIVKCPNHYYKQLLLCFNALLGFEGDPAYQCEIFIQPKYHNVSKQSMNFDFVEVRITPSTPYQTRGYNKRTKNKFNETPYDTTSHCQLTVINMFYRNIQYFRDQIKGKNIHTRFGVFHLQKVLQIYYNASRNTKRDVFQKFYAPLYGFIDQWMDNLDEKSFELQQTDDSNKTMQSFTDLFFILGGIFDLFQKFKSHIKVDQDLIGLKLLFAKKLLKCSGKDYITRRVQSLSLIKSVLEKARSDDNKYRNNNETNVWSTKSHHRQGKHPNNTNNNAYTEHNNKYILRKRCSDFILKEGILDILMSPEYLHEQLLDRLQPIIDVLCETDTMNINIINVLWNASEDKRAIELAMFDKLYLSLSKQLSTNLCREFYTSNVDKRFCDLRAANCIEESHLQFVVEFISNLIDKSKNPGNYYNFAGFGFLMSYAIDFKGNTTNKIYLRKFAFKHIEIMLQKQSMMNHINSFLKKTLENMSELIQQELAFAQVHAHLGQKELKTHVRGEPVDLTYCIEGMDRLLKTKQVGRTNITLYCEIADYVANTGDKQRDLLDVMVKEVEYWYWYCSPSYFNDRKRWNAQKKQDFKVRFDFITSIAQNTACVVTEKHVETLSSIPNSKKMFYKMTPNDEFEQKLKKLHDDQVKSWLNKCVQLNKDALINKNNEILNRNAIKTIFLERFDAQMDENGFKTWLAYFHEVNYDIIDPNTKLYTVHDNMKKQIIGFDDIWKVIKESINMRVVIQMMDVLIKLYHAKGTFNTHDSYISHVPLSQGITELYLECNKQFKQYTMKMRNEDNIVNCDARADFFTMRYALLLRRIMEFSIGKQYPSKYTKYTARYQILYRERMKGTSNYNRNRNSQRHRFKAFEMEVNPNETNVMLEVRKKIAEKLDNEKKQQNHPRKYQLYRKLHNNFIMIEEQWLKYLTFNDCVDQREKKKNIIELEYTVIDERTAHNSDTDSLATRYVAEYDRFRNLQRLLATNFTTTALFAYYVLRYLPMNRRYLEELIHACSRYPKQYFCGNKTVMTVYNIDMLRHFADMKCITNEERHQKDKVLKSIYNKDVFTVLFDLFIDQSTRSKVHKMSCILRLFWIMQFTRLCNIFLEIRVEASIFQKQRHPSPDGKELREFLVLRGFQDRSDETMDAVMNALDIILNANIPQQQFPYALFDITMPRHINMTISRGVFLCFTFIVKLIINKKNFVDHLNVKNQNKQNEYVLENKFLNRLENVGNLRKLIFFGGKRTVQYAVFQGIQELMLNEIRSEELKSDPKFVTKFRKYLIKPLLRILVEIIPKPPVTNDIKHPAKYFKLLTDLIDEHRHVSQTFIAPILCYVFERLRALPDANSTAKQDTILSLLKTAKRLYQLLDPIYHEKEETISVDSHIMLLLNRCLFGGNDLSVKSQVLLCPSGTLRDQAFDLLYTIINIHGKIPEKQHLLLQSLLNTLSNHLNIVDTNEGNDMDDDDDCNDDNEEEKIEIRTRTHRTNNKREHFVGLVNLAATCYFNSILQQLFMVSSFTNEILSMDTSSTNHTDDALMLPQLQRLLLQLRESERKHVNPRKVLNTFKPFDGGRIQYNQQHDCYEALGALFSQLEEEFKHLNVSTNVLDDHFGTNLRWITECCNGHVSTRVDCTRISITVKGVPNLLDGMDKLTEAEVMQAPNAYKCDKCNAKVKAERRLTISKLTKQLIIHLNRFEWNLDTGVREKLNTKLEFEAVLNLKKYMYSTYMKQKQNGNDKTETKHDEDEDEDEYIYDLVGIIIHQGTAERGHYYSYIKDRNAFVSSQGKDEWYQFDDHKVSKKDFNLIQKEAFGGALHINGDNDQRQQPNQRNNVWNKQKMSKPKQESTDILSVKNAYILLYEQRAVRNEERKKRQQRINTEERQPWNDIGYLSKEFNRITHENRRIFRQQTLYDSSFVIFMKKLYSKLTLKPLKQQSMMNYADKKTLTRFVFNVVPIQVIDKNEIKWWWNTFNDAVHSYNYQDIHNMMSSKFLPSYLLNLFGKFKSYDNRQCAYDFFKNVIKIIDRLQSDEAHHKSVSTNDVLDTLLSVLIKVIHMWEPTSLSHSNMEQIIHLINCIDEISERNQKRYLLAHWEALMRALKQLVERDFKFIRHIQREFQMDLPSSNSNLNVSAVCKLMWKLMAKDIQQTNANVIKLNDETFCRVLIAWDYCEEQVNIIRTVVETEEKKDAKTKNLDTFCMIIRLIRCRIRELDFHEVFGALKILNGLFRNKKDPLILEKLNTNCLRQHLQQIISNFNYWKLTEVSILVLSEMCDNLLVKTWIQDNCFSELEKIGCWIQKNQRFKNKNQNMSRNRNRNRNQRGQQYQTNISMYRWMPSFGDRNKDAKKREWSNRMNRKIMDYLPKINNKIVSLQSAFNKINKNED